MLTGLYPPITTPFVQGRFSALHLQENLARWNELPIDGYVVLGSNGEAPLLDAAERNEVIRAARAAIPPGRPMIVGTGMESTAAAIAATRVAFDLGASAVLVGAPTYYRPWMTDEVLRAHYLSVADAAPGPVLLYSVPYFTDIPIPPALFRRMVSHERIAGIKDSSGDTGSLAGMIEAARSAGREVSVLVGNARLLASGLEMGAAGAVLAVGCVAARECAGIARLVRDGKGSEARERNTALEPLSEAVTRRHGIGGLKAALDRLGFHGGDPRPPLPPAPPAAREEIAVLLASRSMAG